MVVGRLITKLRGERPERGFQEQRGEASRLGVVEGVVGWGEKR